MARDNLLKEKKALFISGYIGLKNSGGSAAAFGNLGLCKKLFSNHQIEAYGFCFKEKLADKSVTYLPSYTSRLSTFFNYYLGYAGGVTFSNIKTLHKIIQKGNYGYVFLDSSLLGKLAEHIKKNNPQTIILVFFHNIEKEFFAQVYGNKFLYRPLKKTAALNEKLSSQYADYLLCFNQRDADNIEKYYRRKPDCLFPVIVNDRFNRDLALPDNDRNKITDKIELLFVGSHFVQTILTRLCLLENLNQQKVIQFYP